MASGNIQPLVNYPDLLGVVTGNRRLNMGVVQCALATRPKKIAAGQNFEVLFLIQNAADVDVDVTVTMQLPERDGNGKRGMFFSKSSRLLVGLQPAEVGYLILPASCSPKTRPETGYQLQADIKVDVVDKTRKPARVRLSEGGGAVDFQKLDEKIKREILDLRTAAWAIESHSRKNHIAVDFEIMPQGLSNLTEFAAGWESLWTMEDYVDDHIIEQRVQEHLDIFLPKIAAREDVFKPLLEATLHWFKEASYPLKTVEAIYITKILVLVLCEVGIDPTAPVKPRWFRELIHVLFHQSQLRDFAESVLKDNLYPALINDGIMHSFKMIITVLNEDFGTQDEMQAYADDITNSLKKQTPLNYGQVYLPLISAGVIANNRIIMPGENVRDTLFALHKARESRIAEQNADNAFITEMLNGLIDRALEHF
ncbi:MAG TPA: hypothetical protein VJZ27_00280 [Aggregatilineales bacterium]|nr:hypothetical protein [Aggregatilineales bacterium]